ncbi:hypothetical protein OG834_00795 [Streptomyces mirabilis]|nr:hypothetical protein [Streptomyces mirabilis]
MRFNPPPGWPTPPEGWTPPQGWKPDPAWPAPPPGWQLFVTDDASASDNTTDVCTTMPAPEDPAGPTPKTLQIKQDQTPADPPTAQPANGVDPAPLLARIAALEAELATAHNGAQVIDLSDQRALQDVGIYRYHHPLENAAAYKERLRSLEGQIDEVIKGGRAILAADMFTFDGSLARG